MARTGTRSGLVLVDKPIGPTSFAAVARVRRLAGERQVGHGGTLDPMASGLLPILVGEGTKLVPYLMGLDKEYVATARLGVATDTYDAEGEVTCTTATSHISVDDVRTALAGFVGEIAQRPPLHSALKHEGRRLYELARAGVAHVPPLRPVVIHEISVEELALPDVRFRVRCGKGTYIRSLAYDLGERLGVGAHLTALRRTRVGPLLVSDAFDPFAVEVLDPLALRPIVRAVDHLPYLVIDERVEIAVRLGQQQVLAELCAPPEASHVRLLDARGELVAMVDSSTGTLVLSRVFAPVK